MVNVKCEIFDVASFKSLFNSMSDVFGELARSGMDSLRDKQDKVFEEKSKLGRHTDEQLVKIVRNTSSSNNRNIAARMELKDRGYNF